jgi:hypothetical protein
MKGSNEQKLNELFNWNKSIIDFLVSKNGSSQVYSSIKDVIAVTFEKRRKIGTVAI